MPFHVMPTHYIHWTDAPITLPRGASFIGQRIIMFGSSYGRVLFTDVVGLVATGDNYIAENEFCWL